MGNRGSEQRSAFDIPDLTETERAFLLYIMQEDCNGSDICFARCFQPIGEFTANWAATVAGKYGNIEYWIVYKFGETIGLAIRRIKGFITECDFVDFKSRKQAETCHKSMVNDLPYYDNAINI